MNPYKDIEDRSFSSSCHLTYEDIATKLLKDHHFLTALELHTELVESGKELPQLREFFSNPGNFEQHVSRASECSSMHRTPSQATLDSLDTARYSEDGGGDRGESGGDMAVLEFELRKARETINALRANLTQFADGEVLDKKTKDKFGHRLLKPHEKRTLNFLINEYLLLQNYKMTSITFSDENPDQDFEDWDDVGLNMPRPSNLMSLFWSNSTILNTPKNDVATQVNLHVTTDAECQVNLDDEMVCVSCQTHNENESDWNHELLIQAEEIVLLKQKLIALETEKLNFQKLYDAAIISLNSLTSPTSESRMIDLQIPEDKLLTVQTTEQHLEMKTLTSTAAENHYGSSNSTHSGTPEQFEMIESDKNSIVRKEGSNTSSFEPGFLGEAEAQRRGSVTTLDETLSINDGGEWTRLHYDCAAADCGKDMWIHCGLPNSLKTSIMNWCGETLNLNEPLSNDLLAELVNSDKPMTLTGLLNLVVDTLPRILPHTLVARRSEAAALLAGGAALLPAGDARRARALHALLTLVKKPDAADARLICEAACLVVKWGGGGEVLSAIAELATCRSAERRALAGRACVAVAPYVPLELCSSLLLSLVLLMCDSNEPEMRGLGLKAAALVCPVAEHKYAQLEALMFNFLRDPVDRIVKDTVNMFVPVLARTALLSSGKLFLDLCGRVLENLVKACEDTEWKSVVLYLDVIRVLVFSVLVYVVNVQIVRDATLNTCDMQILNLQEVPLECEQIHFIDLQCYLADNVDVKTLLIAMNSLIKEKPDVRWSELTWFIDFIKQILEVAKNCRALNHPTIYELLITLFSNYVDNFGVQFTMYILKPLFMEIISDLEQKMEKLHSVNVDSAVVVGIYLAAVLPMLEDNVQHGEFLQKWVVYSSIRSLPVKIFSIPLMWLSKNRPDTLEYYLQQLRELLASSCDSGGGGAVRVLVGQLLAELVGSARLAGRCVETQLLPAVAALLHDQQDEVRETGIALWGAVTRAVEADGEAGAGAAARCWELGERAAGAGAAGGRLARAAARALALLVLPAPRADRVSDNAVSLLCALCAAGPLSGECVSALAPGLQLAAHHAPAHPALLPALKKLEEAVQAPSMAQYRPSIEALVQSVSAASAGGGVCGGGSGAGGGGVAGGEGPREPPAPPRASNLLAAQEVGRRVTQMFQHSKTNIHLQNIFKKKT